MPTDYGVVFIRSASATPFRLRALNPQDRSNSSSLTSTNVSVLISRQLHMLNTTRLSRRFRHRRACARLSFSATRLS